MKTTIVLLISCLLLISVSTAQKEIIGHNLLRNFIDRYDAPLTIEEAKADKWKPVLGKSGCDSTFGYIYARKGEPSKSNPTYLLFTEAGQIAGFGTHTWKEPSQRLVPDYWMPSYDQDTYDIFLTFRNSSLMCSGVVDYNNALGDQLLVNGKFEIPVTRNDAENSGWVMGNCIKGMGIHYAYDIDAPFNQTWQADSLFPIMPMYNAQDGLITAILINNAKTERVYPLGDWEGPFFNFLFCKNWCDDSGCTWYGANIWSTMHWLFRNPDDQKCIGAPCVF
eukprot:TRINITY_DN2513_c0_g1_i1.p1 TRINITY_DN2513_c0_g1~~TRINITY_DN2513_c0_g1_i1.p1  ORF type:complete len:290 (-),score=58.05 TRINITY_DN2513_c0_g1_i1:141-977(-)